MNPKIQSLILLTLFLLLFGFSINVKAQKTEATMQETIDFLIGKTESIREFGEMRHRGMSRSWKLTNPQKCELVWASKEQNIFSVNHSNGKWKSTQPTSVDIFLSDFDPTKVTSDSIDLTTDDVPPIRQRTYSAYLTTTEKKKSIAWSGGDKTFTTDSLMIDFDSPEMAKRYGNALRHAITLCGGKAATVKKEPF